MLNVVAIMGRLVAELDRVYKITEGVMRSLIAAHEE